MMKSVIALFAILTTAAPSAAAPIWVQDTWQNGAAPGSTTTAASGWNAYDSDGGNITLSGGDLQITQNQARTWLVTDDSTGPSGFNRAGSIHSTTTASGTGASARLGLALGDNANTIATALPQARGDMVAIAQAETGNIFLFGGRNLDDTASDQILRYTPQTDTLSSSFAPLRDPLADAAGAYHTPFSTMFIFGGSSGTIIQEGIYSYTPSINFSTKRGGVLPSSRTLVSAAYHPVTNRLYIMGGIDDALNPLDAIVEYNPSIENLNTLVQTLPTPRYGMTAVYHPVLQKIYLFGGNDGTSDLDQILEYDPVAPSITTLTSVLPTGRRKVGAAYYPDIDKIVILGGVGATAQGDVMIFDAAIDTLTVTAASLPSARAGMAVAADTETVRLYGFGASSGTAAHFSQIIDYVALSSGRFTSSVFDTDNLSDLTSIAWNPVAPGPSSTTMTLSVRAGNTPVPDGSWTTGGMFLPVANGASLAGLGDQRYLQFSSSYTTIEIATSSVLEDLSISFTQTAASAVIVSSVFDGGDFFNVLQDIRWEGTFPAGTTAHFQIRTSSGNGAGFPGTFSAWLGSSSANDFYTDAAGGDPIHPLHRDGVYDRFFQYRVILYSTNTFSTPALSSVTLQYNAPPSSPTLTDLTALSTTQIQVTITDNATTEDLFPLQFGFTPTQLISVSSATSPDKAGTGTVVISTLTGLSPNRLVFVSARAHSLPPDDLFSSTDTGTNGNIFTLANPPASPAFTIVHPTSMTVSWGANGNAGNTPYEVSLSTDDFATIVSTPIVFADNLTATTTDILSLQLGTTYYVRVRAQNGNAITSPFSATITTETIPIALSGLAVSDIGVTSVTWTWNNSGPAVNYRIFNATSNALIASVPSLSYTGLALATNTLNGIYIEPYNNFGAASISAIVSTWTHAAPPLNLNPILNTTTTITLEWSAAGSPATTAFQILQSSDAFTADVSTPIAFADLHTTTQAVLSGLDAGTTYYFKIQARNDVSILTPFSNTIATPTLPAQLAAPTVADLGSTSITWNWNNTGGPTVSLFDLYIASGSGVLNDNSSVLRALSGTSLQETNLIPNSRHVLQVAALNETGSSALSPATTIFTFAAPPTSSVINSVFDSSVTLSWNTNLNTDLFTTYDIQHSTDNAVFAALASFTLAGDSTTKVANALGLVGLTTHYFRVRARNNASIATSFDVTVSTFLIGSTPLPPSGLRARSVDGARIFLDWIISPTTTVVQYSLYTDGGTGTVDYSVFFASMSADTTSHLTIPLTPNTTYIFNLRARNQIGLEENNLEVIASAVAVASVAAVSARLARPLAGGIDLGGDHLTLTAELIEGAASNIQRILFQYRPSGTSNWIDISAQEAQHPNPSIAPPFATHWNTNPLPPGNYDLRAVARDGTGTDDPFPPSVIVHVNATDPDIEENALGGGNSQMRIRMRNTAPMEMIIADTARAALTRISIASGALTTTPTYLRVITAPASIPAPPAGAAAPGITRTITLESGQTALAGGQTALIEFSRLDQNSDNRVDGTSVRADNLTMLVYDPTTLKWKSEFPTTRTDTNGFTVSARTPHFSLFGLFSPSAETLDEVRVYPIPYMPNNGDSNQGKPYTVGDSSSGILFDNLTAYARVRIYTINGSLVWESPPDHSGGLIRWNVKNGDGRDVASGVYYAVISGNGGTVVRRIAIIR